MKLYVLAFKNLQNNDKQIEVYPTLKLAQIHMRGKVDDAIAKFKNYDIIVVENDYGCDVKHVCESTIDEVEVSFHEFIAHKIVEHYCENVAEASPYYDVIYDIVDGFQTNEYPNIDNYEGVQMFIDYQVHNTMTIAAAKKLTNGVGLSFEKFNKVVHYLYDNVDNLHLAKIINGEMIVQYQNQYDNDNPDEPLFKNKKVWAFSSNWWGGAHFSPDFKFRLFEKYDDAVDALIVEKNKVYADFRNFYDEDEISEMSFEDTNSSKYEIYDKKYHDDYWVGKVEVRYIEQP